MRNLRKNIIILSIILISALIYTPAQADPPGMPGNHGTNGDAPPAGGGAPISGGIGILLTAAAAYGYTKLKNNKPSYQIKE